MDHDLMFDCNGRVSASNRLLNQNSLSLRGEIERILYPQDEDENAIPRVVELFDRHIHSGTIIQELRNLSMHMEMDLKMLCRFEECQAVLPAQKSWEYDFYRIRRTICRFITCVRLYMHGIKRDPRVLKVLNEDVERDFDYLFHTVKRFLNRLRTTPDSLLYYAPSNLGNKSRQPEFHLYHLHLELRWHFLLLLYARNTLPDCPMTDVEELSQVQGTVISDVIYVSLKMFERIPLNDLRHGLPYACTCFHELCLLLQIFVDHVAEQMNTKTFWEYVNDCVDGLWRQNNVTSNENSERSLPPCKNPELFSVWIIYHLSMLYGYSSDGHYLESNSPRIRPNYEQTEKVLKTYIYKGGKDGERTEIDEELSIMIPLLNVLVIEWWQPRVSVICLLWDCFHKRLNAPFLLQASGPWVLSIEKKTTADILRQVRERISNPEHFKECSYGMFLRLLGTFLTKYYKVNDTKYWNQIKGRIYSKFSKSKVLEFSISGLYNFLSLFLTLAVTADTANVCSVMLDLLPSTKEFNSEQSSKYHLIWKGKLAVLLLCNDFKLNFDKAMDSLTDTINAISCQKDQNYRTMMSNYIEVFDIIMSGSERFERGENLLIGGWIDRYLSECQAKLAGNLIEILVNVFTKCVRLNETQPGLDGVEKMIEGFWYHVASRTRQIAIDPSLCCQFYKNLSKLAALFTLESLRNPELARKYKHSSVSLFQHFAASIVIKDIRITRYYLSLILEQPEATSKLKNQVTNFNTTLIQAWIKSSILAQDENKHEIKPLQDYVFRLEETRQILSAPEDFTDFENAVETGRPILVFIMCAMKSRNKLKTEQERLQYDTKWRQYFNHVEKWILTPITEQTKDTEHALWIYRCIGTLLLCTSPMLYNKSQTNPYKSIMKKAVLVTPQSPYWFARHLAKKIFSMIILGMECLNVSADITLKSFMQDLFALYVPLLIVEGENLKVSDPLSKCFKDAKPNFVSLILESLTSTFLIVTGKNEMPKHSYLVMALLQNLVKGDYSSHVVESVIKTCTWSIVNCYTRVHEHHPHKRNTIDYVVNVLNSPFYVREKFDGVFVNVVQKSMLTNQNPMEFLRSVATRKPEFIARISPQIDRIMDEIEQYRRPNAASLRYSWTRLQGSLQATERIV